MSWKWYPDSAIKKMRQEAHKFEASLGYIGKGRDRRGREGGRDRGREGRRDRDRDTERHIHTETETEKLGRTHGQG